MHCNLDDFRSAYFDLNLKRSALIGGNTILKSRKKMKSSSGSSGSSGQKLLFTTHIIATGSLKNDLVYE